MQSDSVTGSSGRRRGHRPARSAFNKMNRRSVAALFFLLGGVTGAFCAQVLHSADNESLEDRIAEQNAITAKDVDAAIIDKQEPALNR